MSLLTVRPPPQADHFAANPIDDESVLGAEKL
jgi:hypothetical protein